MRGRASSRKPISPVVMEALLEGLSNVKRTQRGIDSGGKDYMSSRTTR